MHRTAGSPPGEGRPGGELSDAGPNLRGAARFVSVIFGMAATTLIEQPNNDNFTLPRQGQSHVFRTMAAVAPTQREASIVIVGSFNPAIFQPAWMVRQEIVGPNDIDEAKVEVVTPEVARFPIAWGHVEVVRERFQVRTRDEGAFGSLRDLVVHLFTRLAHTPINKLGINSVLEFRLPDEATWHRVGDKLAPKLAWEIALPEPVRLISLTMRAARNDGLKGWTHVRLDGTKHFGVRFDINNHIELEDGGTEALIDVLHRHWERLEDEAADMAKTVLREVLA
jgi:hypothetical protein